MRSLKYALYAQAASLLYLYWTYSDTTAPYFTYAIGLPQQSTLKQKRQHGMLLSSDSAQTLYQLLKTLEGHVTCACTLSD